LYIYTCIRSIYSSLLTTFISARSGYSMPMDSHLDSSNFSITQQPDPTIAKDHAKVTHRIRSIFSSPLKGALQLLMNRDGLIQFAQVPQRVSMKSFVVLITGNWRLNQLGAQGTFNTSISARSGYSGLTHATSPLASRAPYNYSTCRVLPPPPPLLL